MRARALAVLLLAAILIWAAPLAGLAVAGHSLSEYLGFPPRTVQELHAPFAWGAFVALSLPLLAACVLYMIALSRPRARHSVAPRLGRFPWWGWMGVAMVAGGWALAWTQELVAPGWRRHLFTPLWLGFVIVMNALAYRRSGNAPLICRTGVFLALFPVSAAFWWLFEHLNQFARNWYYSGVHAESDWDYFMQATLPFSTVLPAVASTWAWLRTFPRFDALRLPAFQGHRALAWLALAAGLMGLAGMGLWPHILYPLLWLAPLLLLAGLQHLVLGATLFTPIRSGDWRPLLQPAAAALICGFFWELWNYGSLAKWHYSIPYVERFRLFEMPLLGYAGYLPFGIVCALVIDLTARMLGREALYP